MSAGSSVSHQGCGSEGRGPAPPGPLGSARPLPRKGLTTDTRKHEKLTSVICQLNRGFHRNCPAHKFASVITFQTTPSSVSEFRLLSRPMCISPPSRSVCSAYFASREQGAMPVTSETHVASCLRCEEKTSWDLYNRLCSLLSLVFGSHLQR